MIAVSYLVQYHTSLQIATYILLQNVTKVYYRMCPIIYHKNAKVLLQNEIILLQNSTSYCKMGQFYHKVEAIYHKIRPFYYKLKQFYYKMRQLSQNVTICSYLFLFCHLFCTEDILPLF